MRRGCRQDGVDEEDTAYTFAAADFGFTDPNDTPANALAAVKVTSLPAAGSLKLNGVAVAAEISSRQPISRPAS